MHLNRSRSFWNAVEGNLAWFLHDSIIPHAPVIFCQVIAVFSKLQRLPGERHCIAENDFVPRNTNVRNLKASNCMEWFLQRKKYLGYKFQVDGKPSFLRHASVIGRHVIEFENVFM